jgi:hypothetical protein
MPVSFCPSTDLCDVEHVGDETQQDECKHTVIGMRNALFGTRIRKGSRVAASAYKNDADVKYRRVEKEN